MDREDLDRLLGRLDELDGSDLHLKVGSPPRLRVNGELMRMNDEPLIQPSETEAIAQSIMHDITWKRFEEHRDADFAYPVQGLGRFRANAFYQRGSIGLVFRRVRVGARSFDELNLPEIVRFLADEPRGLILITGPTGCGKTTTLAAMIDHINRTRECHIVTIEDPIEVLHQDELSAITQREVGFDTDTFLGALRSSLREDPDVILVGEMRDYDTIATALTAAETGHLVLSTLHTIDSVETVNRIIDFFPGGQQRQARITLAGVLRGAVCQRLVPTADGSSRVPALEVMVVNGRIQQCILEPEKTSEIASIIAEGDYYGMQTFDQSLVGMLESGVIDLRAAMIASTNPHDLRIMLQRRGIDVSGMA